MKNNACYFIFECTTYFSRICRIFVMYFDHFVVFLSSFAKFTIFTDFKFREFLSYSAYFDRFLVIFQYLASSRIYKKPYFSSMAARERNSKS